MTVERPGAAEAYDCKWGARGINADVLHQLDDARTHAADEDERLAVALVVFDAARSCDVRLDRQTAPDRGDAAVTIETLDELAGPPAMSTRRGRRRRLQRAVTASASTRPGPDGLPADVGAAALRAGPRLDPLGALGFDRDWYAERG